MTLFISRILRGNCWKVQDTKIVLLLPRLFLDLIIYYHFPRILLSCCLVARKRRRGRCILVMMRIR